MKKRDIMVSFGEAIANGFKNYVNFTGRSTRAEYWWWFLFNLIVGFVAGIIGSLLFPPHMTTDSYGITRATSFDPIPLVISLALLLPSIALTIRRLRDTAHHWGWYFIGLIPIVGGIILLVFVCQESSVNGWGEPTSYKNPVAGNGGPTGYTSPYYGS